jgi:predicted XRE-type DNA-binding protein
MLVLPDIYVLKTESIQKKTFSEENLNIKLDEKKINNKDFDKKFLIKIDDLDLPVRVLNFLKTENINYVGELIQYTEKDILSFPNSGRKSLQEIKYELSQINLTLGTKLDKETDLYENIEQVAENKIKHKLKEEQLKILIKEIRNTNLSQRSINGLLNIGCVHVSDILKVEISDLKKMPNLGASSIKEIELFLKNMNLESYDELAPWNEEIIQGCKVYFANKRKSELDNIQNYKNERTIDEEITRVLNQTINTFFKVNNDFKNRILEIFVSRYGLDDTPPKTLEIIGQKFNVTRERIRQIESKFVGHLKKYELPLPILVRASKIIINKLPFFEKEMNEILKKEKLIEQNYDFESLIKIFEIFSVQIPAIKIFQINRKKIFFLKEQDENIKKIIKSITKILPKTGVCSTAYVKNQKEFYLNNFSDDFILSLIESFPMFSWIDNEKKWFTFYTTRSRLVNLILKVIKNNLVFKFKNFYENIYKNYRLDKNFKLSENNFKEFCKIAFDVSFENDNIIFNSSLPKIAEANGVSGNIISEKEKILISVFHDYGPILIYEDMVNLLLVNGISNAHILQFTQFSPLVGRIDNATYALTGSNFSETNKLVKTIKIELTTRSFPLSQCAYVKNKQVYVEVYKNRKYLKTLNYPRPLRDIEGNHFGISYEGKIYPIIN